jgi:hypothetical protein
MHESRERFASLRVFALCVLAITTMLRTAHADKIDDLIADLGNASDRVRITSVLALTNQESPRAIPALARVLLDTSEKKNIRGRRAEEGRDRRAPDGEERSRAVRVCEGGGGARSARFGRRVVDPWIQRPGGGRLRQRRADVVQDRPERRQEPHVDGEDREIDVFARAVELGPDLAGWRRADAGPAVAEEVRGVLRRRHAQHPDRDEIWEQRHYLL